MGHSGCSYQIGYYFFFHVPARNLVLFHDKINAVRPAQIVSGVNLVIVIASVFINPSVDVGEQYRAIVRLVNLEFSVAEDPGRRLPQRAVFFAFQFRIQGCNRPLVGQREALGILNVKSLLPTGAICPGSSRRRVMVNGMQPQSLIGRRLTCIHRTSGGEQHLGEEAAQAVEDSR
jgi:hypothetical protein